MNAGDCIAAVFKSRSGSRLTGNAANITGRLATCHPVFIKPEAINLARQVDCIESSIMLKH